MSGQATGWVLRHGPQDRAMRMVLLTIADACNRDGEHGHPGLDAMVEGSLYRRSHVIATSQRLEAEGWVVVEERGGGRGKATVYSIPGVAAGGAWTPPETVHPADGTEDENGPIGEPKGSNPEPETVQSAAGALCSPTVESNGPATGRPSGLPATVETSPHLEDARRLCRLLAESLEERGEPRTLAKASSAAWVVPMEALLRLDGRNPAKVEWVIRWLHADADRVSNFWRSVIRSPAKLRLKYVVMAEQYRSLTQGAPRAAALHRPGTLPLGDAARQVAAQAPNGAVRSAIPAAAQERP